MFYVFSVLFWWIFAAFAIGLIWGWLTWSRNPADSWTSGWLKWALVAFVVGLILAWLTLARGRLGFGLESGLFMFAFFIVGCILGGWLKGLVAADKVSPAASAAGTAAGLLATKGVDDSRGGVAVAATAASVAPKLIASDTAGSTGSKPIGIAAADNGVADDLKVIKGVGPKNEKILNDLGVFHWCQIAAWTPDNAVWMGHHMSFPGRIERENWISQANILCAGGDTEHSKGVKSGTIKADDAPLSDVELAMQKSELDAKTKAAAEQLAADQAKKAADLAAVATENAAAGNAAAQKAKLAAEGSAATLKANSTSGNVSGDHAGTKPLGIVAPEGGTADDLKLIDGIGPKNEKILRDLGIYHFCQIAAWTPENAEWMGHHMAFPGRIEREDWIAQANVLCAGGTPGGGGLDAAKAAQAEADALNAAPPLPDEDKHEGKRPPGLKSARGGTGDNLKLIKGIGPQNESRLHGLGIWHFDQIAAWTHDQVVWVGSYLAFPGRIDRENWIAQAIELAVVKKTESAHRDAEPSKK